MNAMTPIIVAQQEQLMAHQLELERLYNKNQLISRIRAEFEDCKDFDFTEHFISHEIPVNFGYAVLTQMALHKRASIETMVGLLYHHLGNAQKTVDLLIRCAEADMVDYAMDLREFVVKYELTPDVQEELDRFQYPLPMVVEPRELHGNRESGYFTHNSSVILKDNHTEDDVCLDHLNRMNRVKLTINMDVVKMIKNRWRNLDQMKEGEEREDFEARVRAFNKYDRTARDVMAKLMEHSDHFYLTHRYDKRGRVYSQGYHVNYQGNAWNKAVVEFANKELVD